jgi:hypothetical protein
MITVALAILGIFIVRGIHLYFFLKKVSKECNDYDWKHADKYGFPAVEMLESKHYYVTSKWSAYHFLFMNGPNPLLMFFSLKPLTIEGQYNKDSIDRLKEYEVI